MDPKKPGSSLPRIFPSGKKSQREESDRHMAKGFVIAPLQSLGKRDSSPTLSQPDVANRVWTQKKKRRRGERKGKGHLSSFSPGEMVRSEYSKESNAKLKGAQRKVR